MNSKSSLLGDYLWARRALVQPEDVGLFREDNRRVEGLRRDEVATLAGISTDYYLRLEQGRDTQPSDQVLASLARALQLDPDGLEHMRRMARLRQHSPHDAPPADQYAVHQSLSQMLDQWSQNPAFVVTPTQDIVLANSLARHLGGGYMDPGRSLVETMFSQLMRDLTPNWDELATSTIADLRYRSDPFDPRLQELVGTLSVRDPFFPRMWARHDARPLISGHTEHYIQGLGTVVPLEWQNLEILGTHGHVLTVFQAEPDSESSRAIDYLASLGDPATTSGV
ncbi:helix-turn-helix transcriptional regulator [Leifsonia sp. RAF41]|uniref:helix-turn-helix transcriptional regulator n=1 Tax=Leifsonia sp. RAF41 TaxID=3233056 RepID=UPI003F9A57DC